MTLSFDSIVDDCKDAVEFSLTKTGAIGKKFAFTELDWVLSNNTKTLVDAVGMSSRIAVALSPSWNSQSWKEKVTWVEEVLMLLFILWPLGASKLTVLNSLSYINADVKTSKRVQVAIFMIEKIVFGVKDITPGAKMDIASLRMNYPKLSWLAFKMTMEMATKYDFDTEWEDVMSNIYFPPLIMLVPPKAVFSDILRDWRLAFISAGISSSVSEVDSMHIREMLSFANMVYQGEEVRFMSSETKAECKHPYNKVVKGGATKTKLSASKEVLSNTMIDDRHLAAAFSSGSSMCSMMTMCSGRTSLTAQAGNVDYHDLSVLYGSSG